MENTSTDKIERVLGMYTKVCENQVPRNTRNYRKDKKT